MRPLTLFNIQNVELETSGVYEIYLCEKDGVPVPLNRFYITDVKGLIYIGAAEKTKISYRLSNFLNSMDPTRRQNNHSAGSKISSNPNLRNWMSQYFLYFNPIPTNHAKDKERELLKKYQSIFGELPPLNG